MTQNCLFVFCFPKQLSKCPEGEGIFACSHVSSVLVKPPNLRKKRRELVEAGRDLSKPGYLRLLLSLDTEPCFGLGAELVAAASCAGDRCLLAAVTQC